MGRCPRKIGSYQGSPRTGWVPPTTVNSPGRTGWPHAAHEQWHYAFTNTFSEDESRRLYERYHIPASGSIFWGSVLANLQPGHQDTWVD